MEKRRIKYFLLLLTIILLSMPLSGCVSKTTTYTVTFESYGGSAVSSQTVERGKTAQQPENPVREGYVFEGWYSDENCETAFVFSTPIRSNITLYACWSPNTDLSTLSLKVNNDQVLLDGNTGDIIFYLKTDIKNSEIDLYAANQPVSDMYDDGDFYTHGDDIAGDGIYSIRFSDFPNSDQTVSFIAKTGQLASNNVDVEFYEPLSQDSIDSMTSVDRQVEGLLESQSFQASPENEKKEAVRQLIMKQVDQGNIIEETIVCDENSKSFCFKYKCDVYGGIKYGEYDSDQNGPSDDRTTGQEETARSDLQDSTLMMTNDIPAGNASKSINLGEALVLNDFPNFETDSDMIEYRTAFYQSLKNSWDSKGIDTTIDTNVTVDDLKHLDDYDIVCIATHGSSYAINQSESVPAIIIHERHTSDMYTKYANELKSHQIVKYNTYFAILPDFFTDQYDSSDLENTFVFSETCEFAGEGSSENMSMMSAIDSLSAKSVIGFHNSVYADYSRNLMKTYFDNIIAGQNSSQALTDAKKIWGNDHKEWFEKMFSDDHLKYDDRVPIAYPVLTGNTNAKLIFDGIQNGDFEESYSKNGIALSNYWHFEGDARSVTRLGKAVPVGSNSTGMAMITSGVGSQSTSVIGNGTEGSILYQRFIVPADTTTISFDYNFISEEPMEYVGSKYNDAFLVEVSQEGDTVFQNTYESINTSDWKTISGVNFAGGDNTAFQTGWKTASIDVSACKNKAIVLSFIIYDVGDSLYDSACLIDNVKLN